MKTLQIVAAALLLTACWNTKPGGAGGGGSGGGTGGEGSARDCYRCGEVVLSGKPSAELCSTSVSLFEAMRVCACGTGPCAADCATNLCSDVGADPTCNGCMQSKCASDYAWCSKDQSL